MKRRWILFFCFVGVVSLNAALPQLPEGFSATEQNPVKVFVTFYVDEDGHVRAPNVESAAVPQLIPGAIAAVQQWSFKHPQAKGKPALVFVGRAIRFVPRQSARVEGGQPHTFTPPGRPIHR